MAPEMSLFEKAVSMVLHHEDASGTGVVDRDPFDPGGTTRWGISQRFLNEAGIAKMAETLSREEAIQIYREYFWDAYPMMQQLPEAIALRVFDHLVNAGPKPAFLCLQRAIRACGSMVQEDGVLGPKTRHAASMCPPCCLLVAFRSERAGFYRDLDKPRFETGWVNRAYD